MSTTGIHHLHPTPTTTPEIARELARVHEQALMAAEPHHHPDMVRSVARMLLDAIDRMDVPSVLADYAGVVRSAVVELSGQAGF